MLFSQIQGIFVFKMACFIPNYITQMSSSEYLMGWFIPTLSAHIKNYCYRERRKDLPPHKPIIFASFDFIPIIHMKDKEIKEKVLEKCNFLSFHCLVYIFFGV